MIGIPAWVKLLALAGIVAMVWAHGRHAGAGGVQARWDAAELQRVRFIQTQEAQQRRTAQNAGMAYESERSRLLALASSSAERQTLLDTLQQPACPATGDDHAPQLADLLIPVAAVDRLRRAAAGSTPASN